MPRTPWGRRRTTDSPRPAGRRWAGRLRRSGSLARQMLLVRVGRRRRVAGTVATLLPPAPDAGLDGHSSRLIYPAEQDGHAAATVTLAAPGYPVGAPVVRVPAIEASPEPPAPFAPSLLPGPQTVARRARFALVQGCTLGSVMLGMTAIFLSMHGEAHWAAACLVGCVTFDGIDGALARRLGVASPFGVQMDSLADMCSFGIAAPVVVYGSLQQDVPAPVIAAACALVAACAAIRLARFNVSPRDGRFFCGVPTTMAAAVLGLATLIGLRLPGTVTVAAIALLALAMVSSFPYAKLARIAKLPPWLFVAPVIGALVDYRLTFYAVVALYLASGPLLWLRQRQRA